MRRFRFTQTTLLIAGLCALIFATLAVPLGAQPASETRTGSGIGPVYDAAHEITVNGTIQTVVTRHTKGSPAGMHLMVNGSEGTFDAALGPYMTKETQEALKAGTPLQIIGAIEKVRGREYLLARQVNFNGRTVTVRNLNGSLLLVQSPRGTHRAKAYSRQGQVNGGAR
jgi:hypothetical protein